VESVELLGDTSACVGVRGGLLTDDERALVPVVTPGDTSVGKWERWMSDSSTGLKCDSCGICAKVCSVSFMSVHCCMSSGTFVGGGGGGKEATIRLRD
jgi:ferredoxin